MRRAAIVILAVVLAAPGSLRGQHRTASGFWYSIGVAPGWARVTCDICAGHRQTGISASLGLGGTAGRGLRVGGELSGWRESDAGVTQTLMSVSASAFWYPAGRGLYLRGGAALVMHRASDGTDVVTSSGIGPQLGIGCDYRLNKSFWIAPFAHYSVGVFGGDVKFNGGEAASSATVSFLQVGASITRR